MGSGGKKFDAAFADAIEQGMVTPALSGAFKDPAVAAARAAEGVIVVVIIVLMVVKPF